MAELHPDIYNPAFFDRLNAILEEHIDNFNEYDFVVRVFDNQWPDLDFSGRVHQISKALHYFLDKDCTHAMSVVCDIADHLAVTKADPGPYIFLQYYIESFGASQPQLSRYALSYVRKVLSAVQSPALIKEQRLITTDVAETELIV
jgi:hypothetical protein